MYLSRLTLNPRSRRVQREVANPYEMHRSLMRGFPDNLEAEQERVLFRLESYPSTASLTLLVQSWTPPDWSWLAEPNTRGYLLPLGQPSPAVKSFDLNLVPDQTLVFRLRANPTVKRRFENGDHKRVGIYGEEKQIEWLKRKAEQGGFRLNSAHASNQGTIRSRVKRKGKTHTLQMLAVQFDGLLQVTDPDRLRESVQRGFGSGKGLGFGLLSLAKPPS